MGTPTTRLRLDRNCASGNKRAGTVEGERMSGTASYTQVAEVAVAREPLPLPILTSMRFFAALMVVAHHYDYKDFRLSYCGVTFFFILSGFILAVNYDGGNLHRFFVKRFARIYPTHLATARICAGRAARHHLPSQPQVGTSDLRAVGARRCGARGRGGASQQCGAGPERGVRPWVRDRDLCLRGRPGRIGARIPAPLARHLGGKQLHAVYDPRADRAIRRPVLGTSARELADRVPGLDRGFGAAVALL